MRFSNIVQMGKEYAILGILAVAAIAVIYCIGYFLIYRKLMKGTKKPKPGKLILGAFFVIYLVVVLGVTMLNRGGYMGGSVHTLFSSYRWAWYAFDETEWRNLFLNICMFIPFGFLLPLLCEKLRSFWKIYLTGFLVTLAIEGLQLLLGRGIFEADDVLNNLLGTMIGYGLAYLVLRGLKKTEGRKIAVFTLQIPLLATALFFGMVFFIYGQKEYGNMLSDYSMHLKNVDVACDLELSEENATANIYQLKKYDEQETLEFANEFFGHMDTAVDESRNDPYQNTIVYWSLDGNHNLWVDYRGLSFWYTNFTTLDAVPALGASREEVESALEKMNIQIPERAEFSEEENGYYQFSVSGYEDGKNWIEGTLNCKCTDNGEVESVTQHICTYDGYKTCTLISEKEAFEKVKNGDFHSYFIFNGNQIQIESVKLEYELDSKGYYRPVYYFSAEIGGEEGEIAVTALE